MKKVQVALSKVFSFSAAHRLHVPEKDLAFNQQIYDKCNNLNGHGHDYYLEVSIKGPVNTKTGMIIPLSYFDQAVNSVLMPLDHRHLDHEIEYFKNHRSTGEEIVKYLWQELEKFLGKKLFRLKLWETNNNYFELERIE